MSHVAPDGPNRPTGPASSAAQSVPAHEREVVETDADHREGARVAVAAMIGVVAIVIIGLFLFLGADDSGAGEEVPDEIRVEVGTPQGDTGGAHAPAGGGEDG